MEIALHTKGLQMSVLAAFETGWLANRQNLFLNGY